MKRKFKYAKLNSPALPAMNDKIVVLLPDEILKKGWVMVQLVDEYKVTYGFPFMVKIEYLESFEFIHHKTEDELSEKDFENLNEF